MNAIEKVFLEKLFAASPHKNSVFVINMYNIYKYIYSNKKKVPTLLPSPSCSVRIIPEHDTIELFIQVLLINNCYTNDATKNKTLRMVMLLFDDYKVFPYYTTIHLTRHYKMCDSYDTFCKILSQNNYTLEFDPNTNMNISTDKIISLDQNIKFDDFVKRYNIYLVNKSIEYARKIFNYLELCLEKENGKYINYHLWRLRLNEPIVIKCFEDNGIELIDADNNNKYIFGNTNELIFSFTHIKCLPSSSNYWKYIANIVGKKLFVSIPKNATRSIQRCLTHQVTTLPHRTNISNDIDIGFFGHLQAKYYKVDPEYLITCCRNPYDRAVSGYNFMIEMGFFPHNMYFLISILFRNFYEWSMFGLSICLDPIPNSSNRYIKDFREALLPQHIYVLDDKGDMILKEDNIMHFENLDDDFKRIVGKELDAKSDSSRVKLSCSDKYYGEVNSKIIYNLYKKDFEIFGYNQASYVNY